MRIAPLSKSEILEIVLAVGDGLQYAHERGILHRDTKPSNVLIGRDGKVYITDFGLARIAENASNLTGDMLLGTPHYISPEQARNSEDLDEGTDIYSFGVMIYEMVVGRLLFEGDTTISIIEDHLFTPPSPPTSLRECLKSQNHLTRSCHSEPRSGEESLICLSDFKQEEGFFAPFGRSE
jgi:serine/threonine-protein kinase